MCSFSTDQLIMEESSLSHFSCLKNIMKDKFKNNDEIKELGVISVHVFEPFRVFLQAKSM